MSLDPVLAVIPARLGSKGLPRKNIRPFVGIPLIAYSIRFAAACPQIARCVVSTESEEVAEIARTYGADVPFLRPAELAGDDTGMTPVLQHALRQVESQEKKHYGSVLLLQPTSPVRQPEDVTHAIAALEQDASAVGVIAVAEPPFNPRYVCVEQDADRLRMAFPVHGKQQRRQEVPGVHYITGGLYLWRRDYVAEVRELDLERDPHRPLLLPRERSFDIDDAHDFRMAELAVTSGLCPLPWMAAEMNKAKPQAGERHKASGRGATRT